MHHFPLSAGWKKIASILTPSHIHTQSLFRSILHMVFTSLFRSLSFYFYPLTIHIYVHAHCVIYIYTFTFAAGTVLCIHTTRRCIHHGIHLKFSFCLAHCILLLCKTEKQFTHKHTYIHTRKRKHKHTWYGCIELDLRNLSQTVVKRDP